MSLTKDTPAMPHVNPEVEEDGKHVETGHTEKAVVRSELGEILLRERPSGLGLKSPAPVLLTSPRPLVEAHAALVSYHDTGLSLFDDFGLRL